MNADTALIRAYDLGMDNAGRTEEVVDEADRLLPTLVAAGYAAVDDEASPWWFTDKGVAPTREIEQKTDQH